MPVFEQNYNINLKNDKGEEVSFDGPHTLAQVGPIVKVLVSPHPDILEELRENGMPAPEPVSGVAIIDTGASVTCIDENVCRALALQPTGVSNVLHAGGSERRSCYPIQIFFPDLSFGPISAVRAMSAKLTDLENHKSQPYILMLGRDLMHNLMIVYDGIHGRIQICM